jgi:UDP-N-acetylglucosamine 2-epimerase (non-hydrolysing)
MRIRPKILAVVGARPNFMKTAPVLAELGRQSESFESILVHTGQHYDEAMSQIFLEELGVGEPDYFLGVGSGTHAQQTARAMELLEPLLHEIRPDMVLLPGDVNSTLAASLVAAKLGIPIGHIEAGLRSFDRTMPEEINRIVADHLADLFFIHSPEARENLLREGCDRTQIHDVGNTMIDTLVAMRTRIEELDAPSMYDLERGNYLMVTLHRPALVDSSLLEETLTELSELAQELPIVFPVHPRTRNAIEDRQLGATSGVRLLDPLGYLEFLSLLEGAAGALTDSGGIQEETTFLGLPCFTLRDNTERPITCTCGTNTLLGLTPTRIAEIPVLLSTFGKRPAKVPPGWDGGAAVRIVGVLKRELASLSALSRVPIDAGTGRG